MAESRRVYRREAVSDSPSSSSSFFKPCFNLKRQGFCKFGSRCKFSHDGNEQQQISRSQPPQHNPNNANDGKLRQWKRLLEMGERGSQSIDLTSSAVGRFFQLGLELMDGDVGAAQETIKLLATEPGLVFIKALADRHIPEAQDQASRIALWEAGVKPLFSLVTHPCVVDSAVLEQQVASVFNFILGVGGSRMNKVFTYVVRLTTSPSTSPHDDPPQMARVELTLAVLSKVFDCNTNNMINPQFAELVSHFAKVVEGTSDPEGEFHRLQASKYLEYMQQRLEVGDKIPDLLSRPNVPIARETFVLRRDLPGRLSADGPRHDNDHADITKIQIMPTYDEIVSPRGEYLPTNNPSEWHIQGIRGRLDREFRLVREDTVGQLRDAVREQLELARNPDENKAQGSNNGLRTYTYESLTAVDVNLHRIGGLEMVVRCSQPSAVPKSSAKKRKAWWMQSKRLQAGALVCMFDVTGSMVFCVVSETTMRFKGDKEARQYDDEGEDDVLKTQEPQTLSDDETSLFVNLKLVDTERKDITRALRWYRCSGQSSRRYLVEFPGVLLDSFKHTLSALQQMHEKPSIPFKALLAPSTTSPSEIEVKPPHYARKAGFTFDLSCLTNDHAPFAMDPQRPPAPSILTSQSTLDPTQSAGLLNTLSRELSLIQGPPGTGKSYTGEKIVKVLLESRKKAELGPILCVCYTNHALDQLLEHLLDDGIKGIIRIGSRSKSERLQGLMLRTVAKEMPRTKSEKSELWNAEQAIREDVLEEKEMLERLSSCESRKTVKTLLASENPRHHAELFGQNHDGWQGVIHQPKLVIDRWLQGGHEIVRPPLRLGNLKLAQLKDMTNDERRILHRYWLRTIRDPIITEVSNLHESYKEAIKHRDEVRGDVDLRCLNMADIVGVTTTGLARNLDLLRKLRCKVMLCEEAGEVLEAHVLTALLPSVEHAILIGDHLQLRPQIQNYDLQSSNPRGRQYSLDMSLFERLVEPPHETDPRVPYSILETQRRMHPSIAELVRATLYPSLKDANKVKEYPEVVGMRRRLYWFHHNQLENTGQNNDPLGTSRTNTFEVEMTTALVSHLSRQGTYTPGDIAVLTPYLGQLQLLRRRMESMFEICVNERDMDDLDVLQNDGSDTLPSTTRVSKTTLLKSIRVATVDNFQGEEAKIIVISLVRSNPQRNCGFLSTSNRINVLLSRAQHGMYIIGNSDTYQKVPMWADIVRILSAGDNLGTKLELQCARHPTTAIAVSQPDHFAQLSPESGIQPLSAAQKRSHGTSQAVIIRFESSVIKMSPTLTIDVLPFVVILAFVVIRVRAPVSDATHEKRVRSRHRIMAYACSSAAATLLRANTAALRFVTARLHASRARNNARCVAVILDAAKLATNLVLLVPKRLAGQAVSTPSVQLRVQPRPSLCGEICPQSKYCQKCASDEIKSVCVDFLEMKEYQEMDLNEEPCIFPDCGHFLTVSSMDGQMEMSSQYKLNEDGLPTSILGPSTPFSMDNKGVKACATCRAPLRNISRYGRIVRRAMLDETTKKFISWSNSKYLSLTSRLIAEQERLSSIEATAIRLQSVEAIGNLTRAGSRQSQLENLKAYVTKGRYNAIMKFRNRIQSYAKKVEKDEQPFQRVAELVRHANLQRGTDSEFRYDQSIIQVKGTLLASMLLLKCDVLILSDFFRLLLDQGSELAKPDVRLNLSAFLHDCKSLIQLAHDTTYRREEAQGHVFSAQLYALSRSLASSTSPEASGTQASDLSPSTAAKNPETLGDLRKLGLEHVEQAKKLAQDNPSIAGLKHDIDAAEEALNGSVYRPVTAEELRQVYLASMGELRGTGHWYTCQNGHPFTINNCGMAMEEAKCPECGARIGGQNHVSVAGVRHATEIEDIATEMDELRL
ncbi:hypothetical protein G7046_g3885 [Stylonectria norvegica]|nr:hypothetical protein G7046_g3885 [Stylonectria norvegica]